MKKTLTMVVIGFALLAVGCSRSGSDAAKPVQTTTPNLKSDAERLRQATAKAAEARKHEEEAAKKASTAVATPAP